MSKIRVLVVDDSPLVRQSLSELFASDPALAVIAAVADPIFAMARMRIQWPDVLVIDLALKRMDGMTFLRKIMSERPTPVVVFATASASHAEDAAEARVAGAATVLVKPESGLKRFLQESAPELVLAVKSAAQSILGGSKAPGAVRSAPVQEALRPKNTADVITAPPVSQGQMQATERIVAIGLSTGGTQALERVLLALPRDCPGIVVVQHMMENFTTAFAERLNAVCAVAVAEAVDGRRLQRGQVLIAPGGKHLMVRRSGTAYYAEVVDGPRVNRHKPSVDVLFRSVAKCAGPNALGVIMTGMGDDGARGLLEMRQAGSSTLAQDEATCVVFGMPKEAVKLGAAERQLPLQQIPQALIAWGNGFQ
jgi:two-component system chemotaxis response regulator CheB